MKLDPFGKGAADDGGRNRKEHPLKKHVGAHRNRGVLARRMPHRCDRLHCLIIPSPRNPVVKEIPSPSDPWIECAAVGKSQRLAVKTPDDRHHGRQEQALNKHAQHILLANQTGIKKCYTRRNHEKY